MRNRRSFFSTKWFVLVIFAALVFVAFLSLRAFFQDYQIKQEISRLQSEAAKLEAKKIETIGLLENVKSANFLEEKARLEFNLKNIGENVAIIKKEKTAVTETVGQVDKKVIESNQITNPRKWWNLFTKNI